MFNLFTPVRGGLKRARKLLAALGLDHLVSAHDGRRFCDSPSVQGDLKRHRLTPKLTDSKPADPVITQLLNDVTEGQTRTFIEQLSGVQPVVVNGQSATIHSRSTLFNELVDLAIPYLESYYRGLGLSTRRVAYKRNLAAKIRRLQKAVRDAKPKSRERNLLTWVLEKTSAMQAAIDQRTFYDLEVTIPGTTLANEVLILGAHLDSTAGSPWDSEDAAPGADDDGSGTVALMTIGAALSKLKLDRTVRLVHFSGEEQGLWGSNAYAEMADNEVKSGKIKLVGMMQMDMISYTGGGANNLEVHDFGDVDRGSRKISQTCVNQVARNNLNLIASIQESDHLADRSDQYGFWKRGYAALLISESTVEENPNYHSTNDNVSTLNFGFLVEVIRMMIASSAELAGYNAKAKEAA
jgi:hypothetical protein